MATGLVRKTSTNEITLSSRELHCDVLDIEDMDSQSRNNLDRLDEQALSSLYSTLALFNVSLVSICLLLTGVLRLNY